MMIFSLSLFHWCMSDYVGVCRDYLIAEVNDMVEVFDDFLYHGLP